MKEVSYHSLTNEQDDHYIVRLVRDADAFLSSEMMEVLAAAGIGVWGIYLDRKGSKQPVTSLRVLTAISNIIKDFMLRHNNAMLYYVCDDMMEIPRMSKHRQSDGTKVQSYRNDLFTKLFEKATRSLAVPVNDTPVLLDSCGNTIYIHIIAREKHQSVVERLSQDVHEGSSKPEE